MGCTRESLRHGVLIGWVVEQSEGPWGLGTAGKIGGFERGGLPSFYTLSLGVLPGNGPMFSS